MVIRITQSSQIELADWLGVIGTTRRRGTIFPQNYIGQAKKICR
jgi:hypothetical protein